MNGGQMTTFDELNTMLTEVAPAPDIAEIAAVPEEDNFLIAVDDETGQSVVFGRDERTGKVFMSSWKTSRPCRPAN